MKTRKFFILYPFIYFCKYALPNFTKKSPYSVLFFLFFTQS